MWYVIYTVTMDPGNKHKTWPSLKDCLLMELVLFGFRNVKRTSMESRKSIFLCFKDGKMLCLSNTQTWKNVHMLQASVLLLMMVWVSSTQNAYKCLTCKLTLCCCRGGTVKEKLMCTEKNEIISLKTNQFNHI